MSPYRGACGNLDSIWMAPHGEATNAFALGPSHVDNGRRPGKSASPAKDQIPRPAKTLLFAPDIAHALTGLGSTNRLLRSRLRGPPPTHDAGSAPQRTPSI